MSDSGRGNPAWTPGKSGNPNGRPRKGTALSDLLKSRLDQIDPATGKSGRESMIDRLFLMANSGDLDAIKVVFERTEGKVPDLHTVDGRIQINLKWDDGSGE